MGRAEKKKIANREARAEGVQLDELDYLRLVQARSRIYAAQLDGNKAVQEAVNAAQQSLDAAKAEFIELYTATGKKYQFNPRVSHRFDDKRCLLIPEE